jgi:hypothetical protein
MQVECHNGILIGPRIFSMLQALALSMPERYRPTKVWTIWTCSYFMDKRGSRNGLVSPREIRQGHRFICWISKTCHTSEVRYPGRLRKNPFLRSESTD